MGKKFLSDVIDAPKRAGKPRKTGLTMVVINTPWIDGPLPLLRIWAEYVDLVKFTIPNLWADEEIVVKNIKGYRDLNIDVQVGGVPYELAMMQGKEQQCLDRMKALGVNVFEVESHAAELTLEDMKKEVRRMKKGGFRAIGEVGAKWVEMDDTRVVQDRVNVDRTIKKMKELLEVGAEHVYWEGMVVRALIGNQLENKAGQKELIEVAKEVGFENIVFEVWDARGHGGNKQIWGWLVHQFGPEVNFGNIDPNEIYMLESVRRGCIYDPAHPYLRWLKRGKPTTNWWEMSVPDYSVDIQRPPVWK
jgi:phosphosulfolactate synthase